MRAIITENAKQEIADRYLSGTPSTVLAKEYEVDAKTIRYHLHQLGVQMRPRDEWNRHCSLNQTAFDVITEESAYWIGFLMADGCVVHPKRGAPTVKVGLSVIDYDHLVKFQKFVGSNHKIKQYEGNGFSRSKMVRIEFSSATVAAALARYGIRPRKSATAQVSQNLAMNRHFWRGAIDGDGCISMHTSTKRSIVYSYPTLSLIGSKQLLQQFLAFTKTFARTGAKIRQVPGAYNVSLVGTAATIMLQLLYSGCTVALNRKLTRAVLYAVKEAA